MSAACHYLERFDKEVAMSNTFDENVYIRRNADELQRQREIDDQREEDDAKAIAGVFALIAAIGLIIMVGITIVGMWL